MRSFLDSNAISKLHYRMRSRKWQESPGSRSDMKCPYDGYQFSLITFTRHQLESRSARILHGPVAGGYPERPTGATANLECATDPREIYGNQGKIRIRINKSKSLASDTVPECIFTAEMKLIPYSNSSLSEYAPT